MFRNGEQRYHQLGMPSPNTPANVTFDIEFRCKQNYTADDFFSNVELNSLKLTLKQRDIFAEIMHPSITGTGIDSNNNSIPIYSLTFESSEILTTLLSGGGTAHFAFRLPFNIPVQYSIFSRETF